MAGKEKQPSFRVAAMGSGPCLSALLGVGREVCCPKEESGPYGGLGGGGSESTCRRAGQALNNPCCVTRDTPLPPPHNPGFTPCAGSKLQSCAIHCPGFEFSDPKLSFQRGFPAMRNMENWPTGGSWCV